jgi:membrane protein
MGASPLSHTSFSSSGYSITEIAKRTWTEMLDDDVFGRAAQLAYYFFLALFPFLICVIAGLSVFGAADRGRVLLFQFGGSALPPVAFQVINDVFLDILRASGPLKMSFAMVGSLWAASAGMTAIMDTLNAAYDVKESRSAVKRYALALGLTGGIAFLVILAMAIVVLGNDIIGALTAGNAITQTWKIIQWPLALALILLAFAITYYFSPDLREREWHWVTPGAIAGLISWLIGTIALRIYLHFFNSYTATYGSLTGVIVLLVWFYLSGIAVLSGAVLNAVLERLAATRHSRETNRSDS